MNRNLWSEGFSPKYYNEEYNLSRRGLVTEFLGNRGDEPFRPNPHVVPPQGRGLTPK
jgi:hypothetical protein